MTEEKKIEEMAEYIHGNAISHDTRFMEDCRSIARDLYAADYRKQVEGEWVKHEHDFWGVYYTCSACKCDVARAKNYRFCPDCGAKMKGGE
jgi:rubrerythrin